jgi:chromosomal replication initiation ATPase DnaA
MKKENVIEKILNIVAEDCGIRPRAVKGKSTSAALVRARRLCMEIAWREFGFTQTEIGNCLGGKSACCVHNAIVKVRKFRQTNKEFDCDYGRISQKVKHHFEQ